MLMRPRPNVTALSVLETIWTVAHCDTLHEHMADVDNASLDHLRTPTADWTDFVANPAGMGYSLAPAESN